MSASDVDLEEESRKIAVRWCAAQKPAWSLKQQAGRGGTAPVFVVEGPEGTRALKLYDERFSVGQKGALEKIRVGQQVDLGNHGCPHLITIHDGGEFEGRLFLLMNLANGVELEKVLSDVPREKIRGIVDKVATACEFLRSKGLSHRDIKAANIFISDDFEEVTLLDLSVVRDINDPVGIGTDHGDQLPVVATARYSPPEYLFRLEDPSPDFWHGVDVYQLGGLLHDLIMRVPLFEDEYQKGKENRYRFAWAVATKTPEVSAQDVDQDLIALARRALSKDWQARREIKLSDFRASREGERIAALAILGLAGPRESSTASSYGVAPLMEMAKALELDLSNRLLQLGAPTVHQTIGNAERTVAELSFCWEMKVEEQALMATATRLRLKLEQRAGLEGSGIHTHVELTIELEGEERSASSSLPPVSNNESTAAIIAENAFGMIGELGARALAAR